MARSSRRRGLKMPGVSTKTICASSWVAMPRTMARVVCTLWVTIDTLAPTSWLTSVDLPALGAPISATKPERVCRCGDRSLSLVVLLRPARRRRSQRAWPCGGLFGDALGAARAACLGRAADTATVTVKTRVVVRADRSRSRVDLACRGRLRVRPFLQFGLGVAPGRFAALHRVLPQKRWMKARSGSRPPSR